MSYLLFLCLMLFVVKVIQYPRRAIAAFLDGAVDRIAAFLAGAFFLAIFLAARGFFGLPVGGLGACLPVSRVPPPVILFAIFWPVPRFFGAVGGDIRLGLGLVLTVAGLILFLGAVVLGAGFLAAGFLAARRITVSLDGFLGALRLSGIPRPIATDRASPTAAWVFLISFLPTAFAFCFIVGFPADRDVTDLNAFFTFGTFIFFFGWFFKNEKSPWGYPTGFSGLLESKSVCVPTRGGRFRFSFRFSFSHVLLGWLNCCTKS
tara:strand:+ start:1811 stop:2596 length:786 start_codon:yes stop_codon:yes gene_type:complete